MKRVASGRRPGVERTGWRAVRHVVGLLGLGLATACGDRAGPGPGSGPAVTDSAGIRIVDNGPVDPRADAPWRLAPEPLFRVGWGEGEPRFSAVSLGTLRPDGGAAVVDRGSMQIYELGPSGGVRRAFAREGSGPGELGSVSALHSLRNDTLFVEDDHNARWSLFHRGELVREAPLPRDFQTLAGVRVMGFDEGGRPVMLTSAVQARRGPGWSRGSVVVSPRDALVADTVAGYDMAADPAEVRGNPFTPYGSADVSGGRVVVVRNDHPEVRWLDPASGEVVQIARWDADPRPLTETFWEEFEAASLENAPPGSRMPDERARVRLGLLRDSARGPLPFFREVVGDAEGNAWLGEYRPAADASFYTVIAADGRWIGAVRLPPRFRILDIGRDLILGVERDELDVEAVSVYRMEKAGRKDGTGESDSL